MMAVAEGKQQRFDDKGGKIDVLGDEILSHVLERLPDRLDRLSWCLVCKRFLSVEASCRQYIHLLRSEILSKVLQRYSQVKNLDLSSCIQITDESLETVARLAGKRLLSLKLIRVRGFTCAGLEAIGRGCSSLQEVDLTNCLHVGDATLAGLAQLKNLQSLKILGCRYVTDTGLGFIAASCKQLKLLNLKWCLGIRDAGIMAIASNCKQLHTLDLSYTEVTDKSLALLATLDHLQNLSLMACNSVNDTALVCLKNGSRSLQRLDVAKCANVSSVGIMALANSSVQLQELSLSYCLPITDMLLESFQQFKNLQGIKLDGCDISGAHINLIGRGCMDLKEFSVCKCNGVNDRGIIGVIIGCPGLLKLDLTCCRDLTDATMGAIASSCKGLRTLKMEACNLVSEEGLELIGNGCPNLEELDFTDCSVNDNGCKSIARCTALRFLKLGFCMDITNTALIYIGAGCHNLRELDVYRSVGIGDAGVAAIASGCPRLRVLNLSYCELITDSSLMSVAQLRDLMQLELRACVLLTSVGLAYVAASCKKMVELDIKRCAFISDPGILALTQGCPHLRQINMSYTQVTNEGLMAVARQLSCIQDLKLVHMKHVSVDCFAEALLACGCLKKVKLLMRLRMEIPSHVITQLENRGCRLRWMEKPA